MRSIVSRVLACSVATAAGAAQDHDVVVVLLDDVGTDFLELYDELNPYSGVPPDSGETPLYVDAPVLAQLAADGVLFTNAYAMPRCSPSRASLQTGNYPVRHGVGEILFPEQEGDLREFGDPGYESTTLAVLAQGAGYADAYVGKWHLGMCDAAMDPQHGSDCYLGWASIPERGGWSEFRCTFRGVSSEPRPEPQENPPDWYRNYWFSRNMTDHADVVAQGPETGFEAVVVFEEALEWCEVQTGRFLCVIAPTAPHSPWTYLPPSELVNTPGYLTPSGNAFTRHAAMLEAVDTLLGEFLDGLAAVGKLESTVVIVVGDNGSPDECLAHARLSEAGEVPGSGLDLGDTYDALLDAPEERFKGAVFEKGIRVPLIVGGAGIQAPGRESDALVDITDVYSTVAELMGAQPGVVHGESFAAVLESPAAEGPRDYVYTELFSPTGSTAPGRVYDVRRIGCSLRVPNGSRYKLVRDQALGEDRVYRLTNQQGAPVDPWELDPLDWTHPGPAQDAWHLLDQKVAEIEASGAGTGGEPCGNVTVFCPVEPNSTQEPALVSIEGSRSVCANVLDLRVTELPPGQAGVFFYSQAEKEAPFGDGWLCIDQAIRLQPQHSNPDGVLAFDLDLDALPPAGQILAGEVWSFQLWYRDPHQPGGSGYNLSQAVRLHFCP